jgi:hypothetical protein
MPRRTNGTFRPQIHQRPTQSHASCTTRYTKNRARVCEKNTVLPVRGSEGRRRTQQHSWIMEASRVRSYVQYACSQPEFNARGVSMENTTCRALVQSHGLHSPTLERRCRRILCSKHPCCSSSRPSLFKADASRSGVMFVLQVLEDRQTAERAQNPASRLDSCCSDLLRLRKDFRRSAVGRASPSYCDRQHLYPAVILTGIWFAFCLPGRILLL